MALDNKDATKEQKAEIEQLIRSCEEVHETMEDALKEVNGDLTQLERNAIKAEEEIDKAFDIALSLLEDNKNMLTSEIKTAASERKKQIDEEKDEIHHQETRLLTTLQMASKVVQTGSKYDLVPVYSSLKTNLTELSDIKPARVKKHLEDMSFKPAQLQASHQSSLYLGYISSRYRCVKEGVWKLKTVFGKDGAEKIGSGQGVAITKQGDIAVIDTGWNNPSVKIYNANGDFKSKIEVPRYPWDIVVGPNGSMFVTNFGKHVIVYDVEGNLKQQFPAKSPENVSSDAQNTRIYCVAIDNQNNLLVGENNQKYISKHLLDGTHVISFYVTIPPYQIAVSPQDKIIVSSCNENKTVHIVDESGILLHTLQPPQGLSSWTPLCICCTSDDEVFVGFFPFSGISGSIHSYSTETGDYIGCLSEDVAFTKPSGLALMDNEKKLIVAEDKEIKIFQLE